MRLNEHGGGCVQQHETRHWQPACTTFAIVGASKGDGYTENRAPYVAKFLSGMYDKNKQKSRQLDD